MKKVLVIVLAVLLLAAVAAGGYLWYRNTHIFIEDAVYKKNAQELDIRGTGVSMDHYLQLKSQLPDCAILWDVPFQGKPVSSDIDTLTLSDLTEEDIEMLAYFPRLRTVNAGACRDYAALESLHAAWPELTITYDVDLGGSACAPDATQLTLEEGSYDYQVLMQNLVHLPWLTDISFPKTTLTREQIQEIRLLFPGIQVSYTVMFRGQEWDPSTTEMDLSDLTSADVEEVTKQLAFFPELQNVQLMKDGKSELSLLDVQALQEAAPGATFHYSFTFYKETLSTTDTEVEFKNKRMKDSDEEQIRQILDVMDECTRFVFNNCHISNEVMDGIREDYRDRTKIVWRIFFGNGCSALTDYTVLKAVYGLNNGNSKSLKYCEDVQFIDFGHNESLTDISFIAYMPKLEAIILSGSPIKDLSPFEGNKSLYFLEIAWCGYIEDLTPLKSCENLGMLNIGYTKVEDLSPVDGLPLERLSMVMTPITEEERTRYEEENPDCWVTYKGDYTYGKGWRMDEDGEFSEYYLKLASKEIFHYADTSDTNW